MTAFAGLLVPLVLATPATAAPAPTATPAVSPRHAVAIGTLGGNGLGTRLRTAWHEAVRAGLERSERCAVGRSPVDAQSHGAEVARARLSAAQLLVRATVDESGDRGRDQLRTELTDVRTGAVLAVDARDLTSITADEVAGAARSAVASLVIALDRIPWEATVVLSTAKRIYINRGLREQLRPGTELVVHGPEGPETRVVVRSAKHDLAIIDLVDGDRGALGVGALLHLAATGGVVDDGARP